MKIYLISSRNGELVGFTSSVDANWTATGKHAPIGTPTLGETFRDMNDSKKKFPMITLELTDDQVKALGIPAPKPEPRWVTR